MITRPSIVLLLADQWRGQDQGWLDDARGRRSAVRTPHLDRLAARGAAIAGGCANAPVCGPSRASLLTGDLPHAHGVVANDLPLRPDRPTLATALADAGYATGWIGKWHLAGLPRDKWVPPTARPGIDYWTGVDCSHTHVDGHRWIDADTMIDYAGYEPERQTDLAVEFLARQDRARPFFLTVSYGPPHDPYDSVPVALRRYGEDHVTVPPNTADTTAQRELLALYWSAITAIDDQLGRIVEALEKSGRSEETIIVVTSDHGDLLGAHGRRAKQTPYAEAVRVPLVITGPGVPASRPRGLFGTVDLAPTLLGLAWLTPTGDHGVDLSDRLRRGAELRRESIIGNWVSCDNGFDQGIGEWRGLITADRTYARHADGRPWLLFDDDADPWQLRDLVAEPAAAEQVAEADRRLDAALDAVADASLPADRLLATVGQVAAWNAREAELRGQRARPLPVPAR